MYKYYSKLSNFYCAGGRSVILAKAKSLFLFDGGGSERRRGDPARQHAKML